MKIVDEGPAGVDQPVTGRFLESPSGGQTIQRPPTFGEALIGGQRGAGGLKKAIPEVLATVAPMLVPGAGPGAALLRRFASGPAGRMIAAETGNVAGSLLTGQAPSLGRGAGPQAVGELVSGPAMFLMNPVFRRIFAKGTSTELAQALDANVSAWRGLPATEKGLYERAHGTGQRLLSDAFEAAVTGVKGQLPKGLQVQVPPETIAAMKASKQMIPSEVPVRSPVMPPAGAPGAMFIEIPATDAIDALPFLRNMNPAIYRRVLESVHGALGGIESLGPAFKAARTEYSWGKGWQEFAEKGKFLSGEKYAPEKAMAALDKYGKSALLRRGMDEIRQIVRGPGQEPMTATKMSPWVSHWGGAALGSGLGTLAAGHPGIGTAVGGGLGFLTPPVSFYRNVPRGPVSAFAGRALPGLLGEGARAITRPPEADVGPRQPLEQPTAPESVSRNNPAVQRAKQAGLSDAEIEQRFGVRLTP